MRIEQCEYKDLPKSLIVQARREGAELDQTLSSPWVIFRARWNVETVGFVGMLVRSPSVVTLRGWFVKPKWREQGIGTQLLEAAMTYAFEQGAAKVEIRTARSKIAHRLGFEWTGYERKGGKQERHFVRHG
jgi:RimJ/RimL family protein N-acetyltransferase